VIAPTVATAAQGAGLTGELDALIADAARRALTPALLAASLDNAAEIAEVWGPVVLNRVSHELFGNLAGVEASTHVCRVSPMGGLLAVVVDRDLALIGSAVERLSERLRRPVDVDGQRLWPVISVGVRLVDEHLAVPALLHDVRATLGRARETARGSTRWYAPDVRSTTLEGLGLVADLAAALEDPADLHLDYQPVVDLHERVVVAAEALLRWRHPEHGLVSAAHTVTLAEGSGLMSRLGLLVLDRAIGQASRWHVPSGFRVHVNVSPVELRESGYVDRVAALLERHSFPARGLLLELTETAMMTGPESVVPALHRLRRLGVGLGIDDFGTGYSSIAHLRDLPVDTVKVDRSLVAGIARSPEEFEMARAVLRLLETADVQVQAEGVETAEQVAHLRVLGCRYGQGYHLGRPAPGGRLAAQLGQPQHT
jgi:EAL domain-containing protein (putative c-di-GMP-specific phosphodiesterase class I)